MLADRSKLGSVLEGLWVTSSGVSLRLLERPADFDFSMNARCAADGSAAAAGPANGEMCITRPPVATSRDELGTPAPADERVDARTLRFEMCTADDVRDAQRRLLARLPRPTRPQPPSLELMRAPVWSTWARFKMDVDQNKAEGFAVPRR